MANNYKNKEWLIQRYWKDGKTILEICDECKINQKTLYYWFKKFGIKRRSPHQHHIDSRKTEKYKQKDWLIKEYSVKKRSMLNISEEIGVQPTIIKYWLQYHDIKVEPKKGRYRGERSGTWKGGRRNWGKYWYIYSPEHPRVKNAAKKYLAEHILIMEKELGRYLERTESVHHKDGNPSNNKLENLQLMKDEREHQKFECKLNMFAKKLLFGELNISNRKELLNIFDDFQSS